MSELSLAIICHRIGQFSPFGQHHIFILVWVNKTGLFLCLINSFILVIWRCVFLVIGGCTWISSEDCAFFYIALLTSKQWYRWWIILRFHLVQVQTALIQKTRCLFILLHMRCSPFSIELLMQIHGIFLSHTRASMVSRLLQRCQWFLLTLFESLVQFFNKSFRSFSLADCFIFSLAFRVG